MTTPLRASDLVPGRHYLSPSGRVCKLLAPQADFGPGRNTLLFAYLTRAGTPSAEDGFSLAMSNAAAIASMHEIDSTRLCAARFGAAA